jgi:ATP-dependent Clp protease ATP-binding subunit ClpB
MNALLNPRLGFMAQPQVTTTNQLERKIGRTAEAAARRKFSPEFINRLDQIVTFKPLGTDQLRQVLDIELRMVQERIYHTGPHRCFVFTASNPAKELMLREGTDAKYGARHLKRAVERLLVQPMSNLIATEQVRGGDCIRVDLDRSRDRLRFVCELEGLNTHAMTELTGVNLPPTAMAMGTSAPADTSKTWRSTFFK